MAGFLKIMKNEELDYLAIKYPNAFMLLYFIAMRARRKPSDVLKLEVGESLIGDWEAMGMTQQRYRTAKKQLETFGIVTFKSTSKGTIARLVDKRYYDINGDKDNEHITSRQRATNEQLTTNKKERKKEGKNTEFAEGSLEYISAKRFYELLLVNIPTLRKPDLQKWAKDFDLLYRVDKREKEHVKKVIAFALSSDFWKKNILSPAKLREKFDQLTAQAGDFVIEFDHSKEPFKLQATDWNSKWGLTDKEFRAKHGTGEIYPYLKDWYRKNGQGTSEFEKSNNINQ